MYCWNVCWFLYSPFSDKETLEPDSLILLLTFLANMYRQKFPFQIFALLFTIVIKSAPYHLHLSDPVFIYTASVAVSKLRLKSWSEPFAGKFKY
jgi:hypothetical protein